MRDRRRQSNPSYLDLVLATPGLVSLWLVGRHGSIARDAFGSNHLTYTNTPTLGAVGAPGSYEPAMVCVAASTQYAVAVTSLPSAAAPFSVEFLAKPTAKGGAFIGWGVGTTRRGPGFSTNATSGRLVWVAYGDDHTYLTGPDLTDGVWHHVVGTYDGSTGRAAFVDGESLGATPALADVLNVPATATLSVGRYQPAAPGTYYSGPIQLVAYYNLVLTPAESRAHADLGLGKA